MRLAIADPPYLGRADRWYGDGRGSGRTRSSERGRNGRKPDRHAAAAVWDDPAAHIELLARLAGEYDGWAYAGAPDSLAVLLPHAPGCRVGVWQRSNAMPGGSRVICAWEFVLFHIPEGRRDRFAGPMLRDVLYAPIPRQGFLGSKPQAWTDWVLDLLGFQAGDTVDDLFPGSGAVADAVERRGSQPTLWAVAK